MGTWLMGNSHYVRRVIFGAYRRLTGGPFRSSIPLVRGLVRVLVVAFTIVSLLLVAAVGVAASSGKVGTSNTVKNSVVAVFTGHFDQSGFHEGTGEGDNHHGNQGDDCRHHKKHHENHETGDHENHQCGDGGDDSGSSG
jgi:hypothetical protein